MDDRQLVAETLLYNRIQDDLLILGTNAIVKMNLIFYRTKEDRRDFYYREVQYVDKHGNLVRKMARNLLESFISIENLKPMNNEGFREFIVLRGRDLEFFRIYLLPKLEYIVTHTEEIYEVRDGNMYVNEKGASIKIELNNREKFLVFKPAAHKMYNDEMMPCIEIYLNNPYNNTIVSLAGILDFMHFIRNFNIQMYAATMMSYVGRAPMGLNMRDITMQQDLNKIEDFKYEEPEELKLKRREVGGGFFGKELKRREKENND